MARGEWLVIWRRRAKRVAGFRGPQIIIYQNRCWEHAMRSTFKIELKMDMPQGDEETKDIMRQAMKEAAQTLLAQAVMISDRRPMIAVTSDNSFEGVENIDVSF